MKCIVSSTYATPSDYAVAPSPRLRRACDGLTLAALHTAIRLSGSFAKFTALRWGLRNLADAAERVAAELIARAVEITGNPDPHPRYTDLGDLQIISIRVSLKDIGLLIEVWDRDPTPPQDYYLDNHLSRVCEISPRWSCYRHRGGKVIWAELAIPQQGQAGELPQRTGSALHGRKPNQRVNHDHDEIHPPYTRKAHRGP